MKDMPFSSKLMPVFVRSASPDNKALDDRVRELAEANDGRMISAKASDPSGPQLHQAVLSNLTEKITMINETLPDETFDLTARGSRRVEIIQNTPRQGKDNTCGCMCQ